MAETGNEGTPPIHVLLELAEAATDIHSLFLRDMARTNAEKQAARITARDREQLVRLGSRIDGDLTALDRHLGVLRCVFESYPSWVNAALASALGTNHFSHSQRDDAIRLLNIQEHDFAKRGIALIDRLTSDLPRERTELSEKVVALRRGGPVVTDLDHETGCSLGYLAGMGMIAMGAIGAEPLLVAGAGVMIVTMAVC